MTEKLLEKKLREAIKKAGGIAIKMWAISYTGLPDRLVLLPVGQVHFVELKSPGQKPRPVQIRVIDQLKALGFQVHIIDGLESLQTFLNATT